MRTDLTAKARTLLAVTAFLACPLLGSAQVVEYYHLDGLGSVRAMTNQAGQVVERHDYLPWGEEHAPGKVCPVGPPPANLPDCQTIEYTGKERDAETGQDYFGARYYGAKTGRFTAVDPVYTWNENIVDPQRWNRYAYGRNNPLRYVDPDGRAIETPWDIANVVLGAGSLISNVAAGNVGGAIVDVAGLAYDIGATAVPGLPGGAGTAIRTARAADKVVDIARAADRAGDAARAGKKLSEMSAAERRAHFLEKGVPAAQIGPSGYPKVHAVDHSTKKAAREAAEQRGRGEPMHHPSPTDAGHSPHYHATDAAGKKVLPNVHDNYPKNRQ